MLQELLEQRIKSKFLAQRCEFSDIRVSDLYLLDGNFQWYVRPDGGQLAAKQCLLAEVPNRFPVALPSHLIVIVQHGLQTSKTLDQLRGALRSDITPLLASRTRCQGSRRTREGASAWDVIRAVARESEPVHHFARRYSQDFLYFGLIAQCLHLIGASRRLEHANPVVDKLKKVLVTGHDHHVHALRGALLGQRANDVICFEALLFDNRNSERPAEAAHVRKLHGKILGEGRSVGFVSFKQLVAEGRGRQIEHHGDMFRPVVFQNLAQRPKEDINGLGRHAGGRD